MAVFNMVRGKVDLKNGVRMGRPKRVVRGLDSNHNRVIKMTGNKKKQGRGGGHNTSPQHWGNVIVVIVGGGQGKVERI